MNTPKHKAGYHRLLWHTGGHNAANTLAALDVADHIVAELTGG